MATLPIIDGGFRPTRVIVDAEGLGTTPTIAWHDYRIAPHIIFIREDNWSLGAPAEFEHVAYSMWKDSWTHFTYIDQPGGKWIPIAEYN